MWITELGGDSLWISGSFPHIVNGGRRRGGLNGAAGREAGVLGFMGEQHGSWGVPRQTPMPGYGNAAQREPMLHAADVRGCRCRAVPNQRFGHDFDTPPIRQEAEEEVPILEPVAHRLVVAAATTPPLPAEEHDGGTCIPVQEVLHATARRPDQCIRGPVHAEPTGRGSDLGILLQYGRSPSDEVGLQLVIAVQDDGEFATQGGETPVSGGADPGVGLETV